MTTEATRQYLKRIEAVANTLMSEETALMLALWQALAGHHDAETTFIRFLLAVTRRWTIDDPMPTEIQELEQAARTAWQHRDMTAFATAISRYAQLLETGEGNPP